MAEYDIIIRKGTIVDGTRAPRFVSDLAIKDGKIAKIGGLRGSGAGKVLDASGLIVAPGFIDLHTHYDGQLFWDPYCSISGWHGVTSVAIGNCGFGFAPVEPKDRERAMLCLTRNEAIPYESMEKGMNWDWVTFPEFMDSLDRIPKGINVLSYVPLTPLYSWVMGWDGAKERRPTKAELDEMCRLMHLAMDAGACGWSSQVLGPNSNQRDYDGTPMTTDLMTDEEILTFARVLAERDEGFIELTYRQTGEDGQPLEQGTLDFLENVTEVSGRPLIYQLVLARADMPDQHRMKLDWLEECNNKKGLRMGGQGVTTRGGFELTFEDWNLFDDSPAWRKVTLGTVAERTAKMEDPDYRRELREEWDSGLKPGRQLVGSLEGLVVEEVGRRDFEKYLGLSMAQIAEMENKHVVDALCDLVVADKLQTEFLGEQGRDSAQFTAEVMNSMHVIPGISDGGAHTKFLTGGAFPTEILTWLVKEEGLVSLEEAHYKLSALPAFFGGVHDRGFLREGAPADVVVYDMDKLKLLPTEIAHDLPGGDWRRVQKAEGYRWTIVNGEVTFEDGAPTGALPGKLLRKGRG